jgi:hypothetical protein
MNILCNPMGKKGHFSPIDWIIEHNNLYVKVSTTATMVTRCRAGCQRIYGGKFSNHTQERIIKQSTLIEVFKNICVQFELMFCLEHKTIRHSPPKMKNTFDKLGEYMHKEMTHIEVKGWTGQGIVDAMAKGMHMSMTGNPPGGSGANGLGDLVDDAEQEVEDDGDLDT